jgi:hypothetical protein
MSTIVLNSGWFCGLQMIASGLMSICAITAVVGCFWENCTASSVAT